MSLTQNLQSQALQQWQSKQYSECKQTLTNLLEVDDQKFKAKVQHNYLLADFALRGFEGVQDFVQGLDLLKDQLDSDGLGIVTVNKTLALYNSKGIQAAKLILNSICNEHACGNISRASSLKLGFILIDAYLLERKIPEAAQQMQKLLTSNADLIQEDEITQLGLDAPLETPKKEALLEFPTLHHLQLLPLDSSGDESTYFEKEVGRLKALFNYYQARLYLHAENFVLAEAHLNRLFQLVPGCPEGYFVKVELLAEQDRAKEAVALLTRLAELGGSILGISLCNLANICALCKHSQLGQQFQDLAVKSLPQMEGFQRYCLMYNVGVQNIAMGQYERAVESFIAALEALAGNPLLWLRLGEAVLQIFVKWMKGQYQQFPKVFSSEEFQIICSPFQDKNLLVTSKYEYLLQFAKNCFRNSFTLLTNENQNNTVNAGATNNGEASFQQLYQTNRSLIQQLKLKLAYIHLQLQNPQGVLNELGNMNEWTQNEQNMMLACSYIAEAYCELNKPKEAAEALSYCLVSQTQGNLVQIQDEEGMQVHPLDETNAQVVLYVNLAAVYATQKDYLQAHQCTLKALSFNPRAKQALMMMVYVEICRGNASNAVYILKNQCLK
eukprot:TRINITY_DN3740_c1_g1_i6.p1 TRINITY_DN3740_c1_g1~~TRINITY_DN3740_c1_g1_i6.p1  ORF type:complete len:611 (-),score=65.90 TRINITY_DN3740_c1_g1_i6:603-2435(-)